MRQLGLDVSRETGDRLEALVSTLERWQKAINLVGKTTMGDIWRRHVLDSAQLKALIPDRRKTLTDLGSGAGFPGLVVAALRPDLEVTLIESDARKAAFLGEAARRMTPGKAAKNRHRPHRGRGAGARRRDHRPRAGAARPTARLGRPAPNRYRYLPFPQGEGLAG